MSLAHELIAYVVADRCAKLFREEKFDFAKLTHFLFKVTKLFCVKKVCQRNSQSVTKQL